MFIVQRISLTFPYCKRINAEFYKKNNLLICHFFYPYYFKSVSKVGFQGRLTIVANY